MTSDSLADALAREHHAIDDAIAAAAVPGTISDGRRELRSAIAALRRHIYLEEELLFPALYAAGDARLVTPMMSMLREHGQIWQRLESLDGELGQETGPAAVARSCHLLLVQLQHHDRTEERVVYAEIGRSLPPQVVARAAGFLESGVMPEAWVCLKARH